MAGTLQSTLRITDGNGNLIEEYDELGRKTVNTFDTRDRITSEKRYSTAGTLLSTTGYTYDSSTLTHVTDPEGLATQYQANGFGEVRQLTSPDTGIASSTYLPTGRVSTKSDARLVTTTYTYDDIDRVKKIDFAKTGTTTETHEFEYDGGATPPPNAKGRLTKLTEKLGATVRSTTTWAHTPHGRVSSKTQTVGISTARAVSYGYTAGNLTSVLTPAANTIEYVYANGRVSSVKVNGTIIVTASATLPFGPIRELTWTGGLKTTREHDSNGRLRKWEVGTTTTIARNDLTWDLANQIVGLADPITPSLTHTYQHDGLARLEKAFKGTPATTKEYTYDKTGNRKTFRLDAATPTTYSYYASTNRLQAVGSQTWQYDNGGNPTTIGGLTSTYNNANRLTTVGSAAYKYNALGQRIEKTAGGAVTQFVYDEGGRLMGEYTSTGGLIQETVWLDDLPVATIRPKTGGGVDTYYVHADHLGSPRLITRSSDHAVTWKWENADPFGNSAVNENPNGAGVFNYGMRFPGQYFDAETGRHYNYFRDYDPAIGRYSQSDPIGLEGGINTYVYVENDPLSNIDATGLKCKPSQQAFLQFSVNLACKWSGDRRCDPSDDCLTNNLKLAKNSACAGARKAINQKCFGGGDPGHKEAYTDAVNAVKRCLDMRANCCA